MRRTDRANVGIRSGGALALIGVAAGIVPLFVRGWLVVRASFAAEESSGAGVLRRIGVDVDRPVAAVADRVIGGAIPPTMWQVQNNVFRTVALLLALAALLLLGARVVRRGQRGLCRLALASGGAAAILMVVAALHIRAQIAALPGQISAALGASGALTQAVGGVSTPQVAARPGWPLIAMAAAVGVALLGAAIAAVASARVRPTRHAAILSRRAPKEYPQSDTGDPAAV